MPLLTVDGLWKRYGDRTVLRGIDLEIARHEVVCLIGPSGSGKSTLLRCVNLLETVDDGAIFLDGVEITAVNADEDAVRRRIGMVFQSYNLFPHMTVLDNITLAPVKVHGRPRAEAVDEARALLARFGLADKAADYPDRLSGGQQQRVAIIRALACRPEVILLDEVTSALDPALVGEVLTTIRDLRSQGMTMLLATHELAFAREIADTVCFLSNGELLEQGPPSQLLKSPHHPQTRTFLNHLLP
ncbi:amino acid ABC transporter ATP-binding protein [Actinocorallia sp. A-T 12471]|uniref:amino acid ABC transporter ATP-binding protein n=1 Tax=Actinocorallia sp. A-T 12471 TaxID=3089813 RepID=UPI0029CE53B6|nr:amino acid ABC transporter ATP-binding protein [Actinocorallia sp. A-T 12471]MDX6740187.1 amino acid ABC transporter ATP-binding protein [Actinocorallia sp. A-T 12471]